MEDNKKQETEKEKSNVDFSSKKENDTIKIKIGTIGNFVFAAFIIVFVGTASLAYYLIHSAKDDYDKTYNDIVSNIIVNEDINKVENDIGANTVAEIIDSAISDVTTSQPTTPVTDGTNTRKTMNEELVVLYNGLILNTNQMEEVTLKYIDNTNDQADKYVITYYNYENYSYKDSKLGILSSQLYEGLVKIDGVSKIAISEDYDAIPRTIKVVNTIPTIVSDNNKQVSDYDTVKTLIVDLDGNQSDEYILVLANKTTGFSKIVLIDSKGSKVADLASIEKSQWKKDSTVEYYLSLSNIDIIDVDNDGIMEILVEIPHATGNSTVSLLKYRNGELLGKQDIKCSFLEEKQK